MLVHSEASAVFTLSVRDTCVCRKEVSVGQTCACSQLLFDIVYL